MDRNPLVFLMILGFASLIFIRVYEEDSQEGLLLDGHYREQIRKMQAFKASSVRHDSVPSTSRSPNLAPTPQSAISPHVFRVTSYGADPTGETDSTEALMKAV
ncbi:Pectin lyase-like superfamily protein isoform 1 [Tripterygium wilfordii]|uniref:Pectin lyase-like superfamily protein isoform 1 n=1 Tax=Tripterygium wilfordii TaxID=458696 RepID=A0A7J7CBR5_TRIWF|nr:Pectin lyase-like superfamily protein isoform 1 [Tripterygium wilfordii]